VCFVRSRSAAIRALLAVPTRRSSDLDRSPAGSDPEGSVRMLQSPRDAVQSCSRCCPLQVKGIRIHLHGLPIQNPALSSQLHLVRTPHQTEAHHLLVYQAVFLWRTALQVSLFPSLLFWLTLLWRS